MRTIRASEIGSLLYCERAWWYRAQGYEPANQDELIAGTELHYRHTRAVLASSCLRVAAYVLLLAALVLLAIYFTTRITS